MGASHVTMALLSHGLTGWCKGPWVPPWRPDASHLIPNIQPHLTSVSWVSQPIDSYIYIHISHIYNVGPPSDVNVGLDSPMKTSINYIYKYHKPEWHWSYVNPNWTLSISRQPHIVIHLARAGNVLSTASTVADVKCLQVVLGVQRSTGTFSTGKWEYHEYKMGILYIL